MYLKILWYGPVERGYLYHNYVQRRIDRRSDNCVTIYNYILMFLFTHMTVCGTSMWSI